MALTFIYSQWIKNKKYSLKRFLCVIHISLHIFHSNGGDNSRPEIIRKYSVSYVMTWKTWQRYFPLSGGSVFIITGPTKDQRKGYETHYPNPCPQPTTHVTNTVRKDEILDPWMLGSQRVQVETKLTHLGLLRAEKAESTLNISERISVARRTLYALIKTGVHGSNGLNPRISYRIYQAYVIPRLLYSLNVMSLSDTHINQLQRFHISTLRRIQSLPERTASSVVQLLLGALPIQAELHKRQLS